MEIHFHFQIKVKQQQVPPTGSTYCSPNSRLLFAILLHNSCFKAASK